MDVRAYGRRAANRIANEARGAGSIARTGVLRPGAALHGAQMARTVHRFGAAGSAIGIAAAANGARVALIDELGSLSFADLDGRSNAVANELRALGVRPGDGVGILCRNHRGMFDALFAAGKIGARTVLLNTDFSGPQLRDVAGREGVRLLISDEEFGEVVAEFAAPLGHVLAWHDRPPAAGALSLEGMVRTGSRALPPRAAEQQSLILLTSGTTGTPKGATREVRPSLALPGGLLSKIPYRSRRTTLIAAPIFHAWGMANTLTAISLGSTVITHRRIDPQRTLADLARYRVDTLATLPIVLSRILALGTDTVAANDLTALRIIAMSGSALSADLGTRALAAFGDVVYNLYGSTEVAIATVATPSDIRAAPGCAGRAPFGVTVRLYDEQGQPARPGQSGRIFVGNGAEFGGYTGGGTKQVIDGLMSTGDVGRFDSGGRLFVEGRDDDMIVSGGENVFPREVEELLTGHPAILDAVVVGVPDAEFGSRLRAYVVSTGPADIDEDGVRDHVRANLARYKVPREVRFLDELPRNPAGKVMRRLLPD